MPKGFLVGITLTLSIVLAGCGGEKRLSASEYRARLKALGQEAAKAQGQVEKATQSKSMVEFRKRLLLFSQAEQRVGEEVAKLKPPKDAQKANDELARGEHDTAGEIRTALAHLTKVKTVKAALGYLNENRGLAQGGREVDEAVSSLRKLGYTTGS